MNSPESTFPCVAAFQCIANEYIHDMFGEKEQNLSKLKGRVYSGPAEPVYTLPLQTVYIQNSWLLLQKPTDLDLHCLSLSM